MAQNQELEVHERALRAVFDPTTVEFSGILARVSVLFEDLRIEEYASRLDTLHDLDVVGSGYRKIYFLRRSIATLWEFAGAIEMLDQRPVQAVHTLSIVCLLPRFGREM